MTEIHYTYSMKIYKSPIIIIMVISILFLILPLTSAIEFELISPESANAEESFSVSISSSSSEIHDVKIFVQDSAKKIISQIQDNDEWKSPRLYLKSAFPEDKEFKIRVVSSSGNYEICARLRKTGKTTFSEKCRPISINPSVNPDQDLKESKNQVSVPKEKESPDEDKKEESEPITPQVDNNKNKTSKSNSSEQTVKFEELSSTKEESQKIMLNKKSSENKVELTTKYGQKETLILYGFIFLCIILIIILALNKL